MGLESHVNQVLDTLGFKRSDWQWSFGDFIARSPGVARVIVDALNDEGQFRATARGSYVDMRFTGRRSGGKRRAAKATSKQPRKLAAKRATHKTTAPGAAERRARADRIRRMSRGM